MSLVALSWAFPIPLTGPRKAVLLALADHADDAGECWPSVARLVLFSGVQERAVRNALRDLEAAGLIATKRSNGRTSSRYVLAINPAYGAESQEQATRHDVPPNPASHTAQPGTSYRNPAHHTVNPASDAPEPSEPLPKPPVLTLSEPPSREKRVFNTTREQRVAKRVDPTPDAIATWNRICGVRLPIVAKVTEQRKQAFGKRFREDLGGDPAQWESLCRAVIASDFLTGSRGFEATFDWVIKPANLTKILEGNYANRATAAPVSNANAALSFLQHVATGRGGAPRLDSASVTEPPGYVIDIPPGDYHDH